MPGTRFKDRTLWIRNKMSEIALEVRNLTKIYSNTPALKGISFTVKKGELFSLLGPNGAGKTTTLRIITSLTKASGGTVLVFGKSLNEDEKIVKRRIGFVPQHINLDMELTVRENLLIHGLLYGMPLREIKKRTEELLEIAELKERGNSKVKELSGGLKRRLLIIRALMHSPALLLLDEPTVGLDPHIRRKIWGLIKQIQNSGTTILLTTHYMDEAELLSDRVAFIISGEIIAQDSPLNFIKKLGEYALDIFTDTGISTHYFKNKEDAEKALQTHTTYSNHVTLRKVTLEDIFVKLTERHL